MKKEENSQLHISNSTIRPEEGKFGYYKNAGWFSVYSCNDTNATSQTISHHPKSNSFYTQGMALHCFHSLDTLL